MAATVDLGQQLQFEDVSHLPPRAPSSSRRPSSGCFHNRGRLFSTLKQQPADSDANSTHTSSFSSSTHTSPTPPSPDNTSDDMKPSFRHPRVQSAKARLERSYTTHSEDPTVACIGNDIAVYDVNSNLNLDHKPFRRNSRGHTKDSSRPFLHQIYGDRSASRPSSAKVVQNLAWIPDPSLPSSKSEEKEKEAQGDPLKPSVYGYRLKRQVYGSNANIFTASLQNSQASHFKLDQTPHTSHSPKPQQRLKNADRTNGDNCSRTIPWHMEPLRPWLTQMVPQEVIGIDPSTCLVFLPLNQTFDDLPVVPLQ